MGWAVVQFTKEDSVEVVPRSWFVASSKECFWPPNSCKREKIIKFIEQKLNPSSEWNVHPAQILGNYDDFSTAQKKAKKAMMTSDLSSGTDNNNKGRGCRKRKRNYKYGSDSSSGDASGDDSSDNNSYPQLRKKIIESSTINEKCTLVSCPASFSAEIEHTNSPKHKRRDFETSTINEKCMLVSSPTNFSAEVEYNNSPKHKRRDLENTKEGSSTPLSASRNVSLPGHCYGETPKNIFTPIRDTTEAEIRQSENNVPSDSDFKRMVLDDLSQINLKINSLIDSVATLINTRQLETAVQLQHFENNVKTLYEKIPVRTKDELEELEDWLHDENNYNLIISELRRLGGNSIGQSVRKILYRLLADEVALLFSWDGAKLKSAFKNLRTAKSILDSMKIQHKEAKESEIIDIIKYWLVKAKERISNKNKEKIK